METGSNKINPPISPIEYNARDIQDKKHDPRTYDIIGAAIEVYNNLGSGFLEGVYQEALAFEFKARKIPFEREFEFAVSYKGQSLKTKYRADFLCFDLIIVELKALGKLSGVDEAQLMNYLKATGKKVGLLMNFGGSSLFCRRLVF